MEGGVGGRVDGGVSSGQEEEEEEAEVEVMGEEEEEEVTGEDFQLLCKVRRLIEVGTPPG